MQDAKRLLVLERLAVHQRLLRLHLPAGELLPLTALRVAACAALLVLAPGPARAQAVAPDHGPAILEELRQIRALLERLQPQQPARAPQPEGPVTLRLDGAYVLGRPDAPVTMVEFTDYECPFCRQFHMASFDELKRKYIDSGKVRYVSRDFPLEFHPNARAAAKAARCAGEQGRFWEMRRALIVNGNALGPETLRRLGEGLKLDAAALEACIAGQSLERALEAEMEQAKALGISGTPTFILGRSNGESVEGIRIVGAQPLATFEARIQALLGTPQ